MSQNPHLERTLLLSTHDSKYSELSPLGLELSGGLWKVLASKRAKCKDPIQYLSISWGVPDSLLRVENI